MFKKDHLPDKPHGNLTVISARNRFERRSSHAAWAEVIVVDENGNEWVFDASAFSFDMRPNESKKSYTN